MRKKDKEKARIIILVLLIVANVIITNLEIDIWWKSALIAAILTACFALGQW